MHKKTKGGMPQCLISDERENEGMSVKQPYPAKGKKGSFSVAESVAVDRSRLREFISACRAQASVCWSSSPHTTAPGSLHEARTATPRRRLP